MNITNHASKYSSIMDIQDQARNRINSSQTMQRSGISDKSHKHKYSNYKYEKSKRIKTGDGGVRFRNEFDT